MGSGLIGSSVSGLQAAQLGLLTTEHNIANVNTAGFNRQRSVQATNPPLSTGAGFVGQGTHVATIERMYSRFLTDQVDRSQTRASELDTYHAQISQIDNMLADPSTGLSPALQDFFAKAQDVAANPAQLPSRQAMVAAGQALGARYQSLAGQLAEMYGGVNAEIKATVGSINSYAEQIGSLNQQIVVAEAATGQPANDLLDTRDRLVAELNTLVKARTTTNSDGSYNVFIGSGQQLVVGPQVMRITTTPSSADPARLTVGLSTAAGVQEMPEALLRGGSLGGLLQFRSESLDQASNDLGRNAASLALTFNAQSALGQDLLGQSLLSSSSSFSPNFFSIPSPTVIANTGNPPSSPTVSAAFVTPPPFNGNFYTDLVNSDYRLDSDGSSVTLTRLSDNKQWSGPGADVAVINVQLASDPQGFTLAAGPLLAGSSYLVQPTRAAATDIAVNPAVAADPSLIAAAGPIRTSTGTANTGGATISAGSVGPGYPAAVGGIPISLVYQAGELRNFPVGARVSIDGGAPVVIGAPTDGVAYTSGATLTLLGSVASSPPTGFSFVVSGLPNNGDSFVIARNAGATADGRNALALAQLQTQATMSGQTDSYQQAYAQLVSETGSRTRQIQVSAEAQTALLEQAQASRESLSGVNLDEEAANLIRYQQAYQASARALQIGASLFDTILALGQ